MAEQKAMKVDISHIVTDVMQGIRTADGRQVGAAVATLEGKTASLVMPISIAERFILTLQKVLVRAKKPGTDTAPQGRIYDVTSLRFLVDKAGRNVLLEASGIDGPPVGIRIPAADLEVVRTQLKQAGDQARRLRAK